MTALTNRVAAGFSKLRDDVWARRGSDHGSADALAELSRRVDHLESQLEALQDAVYRQDVHHDQQIADLRTDR